MKQYTYSIKELIEVFYDHAVRVEENRLQWIRDFKENNPNQPLPDEMKDTFSISKALASMCTEIQALNQKIDS